MTEKTTRLLVTGAAGNMGAMLRPRLRASGRTLRLMDVVPVGTLGEEEEFVEGSITDRSTLVKAFAGVDAVLHLGGISKEAPWSEILSVNVDGTQAVLEASVAAGVSRVVLASSNHAVGFWTRDELDGRALAGDEPELRPDSFYGWSKAAVESLGRLYHDRYGLDIVNLRIGSSFDRPHNPRALTSWMSPDDTARLVEAALSEQARGFHTVWGVSNNSRSWWSGDAGAAIGFKPVDDAEIYASEQLDNFTWDENDPVLQRVGGAFCDFPLGDRMP